MTSEESRYADILIARCAQRKHLAKETEILQTEATRLGRSLRSVKVSFPKALLSEIALKNKPNYFYCGSVMTQKVKQLARLEPCAIELEHQWQEQKSVQSLDPEVPLTRGRAECWRAR